MRAPQSLLDATNTVAIGDDEVVADAIDRILEKCFGAGSFDRELLHAGFERVGRLFAGEHPGYLACDMPYHDLRHSLDTSLVMARLIAGYQSEQDGSQRALTPELGLLGVLLGVLHDTGFIRKTSEAALCGPQLMPEHESRSVEFARSYLETTSLAKHAALAQLIFATRLGSDLKELFAGHEASAVTLGQMLGSADPYAAAMQCNLDRFARVAAEGPDGLLEREPPITTTRNLAAIYHARPPAPAH